MLYIFIDLQMKKQINKKKNKNKKKTVLTWAAVADWLMHRVVMYLHIISLPCFDRKER